MSISFEHVELDRLESLWTELRDYHRSKTSFFDQYYANSTFEKRKAELQAKDRVWSLLLTEYRNDCVEEIGFCIATIERGLGKIESIYVRSKERRLGFGTSLLHYSVELLRSNGGDTIQLMVGEGNESVIGFYEKHGFVKRATQLELMS